MDDGEVLVEFGTFSAPAHTLPTWVALLVVVWAFGLGATIGSFLNVVIYRLPRGQKVSEPRRSHCPACNAQIAWFDNIPVLSWLLLRGRCRSCTAPISVRYPFVELLIGVLGMAVAFRFGLGAEGAFLFVFAVILIAVAYIDLDTFWIPWSTLYALYGVGLVALVVELATGTPIGTVRSLPSEASVTLWALATPRLVGGAAGFLVLYAFKVVADVYFRLRGRIAADEEAMGLGDPLLLGGVGLFLGWQALPLVVFLGSFQGAIAGLLMKVTGRLHPGGPTAADDEDSVPAGAVPFGPFLALGALEVAFFGADWLPRIYGALFPFD